MIWYDLTKIWFAGKYISWKIEREEKRRLLALRKSRLDEQRGLCHVSNKATATNNISFLFFVLEGIVGFFIGALFETKHWEGAGVGIVLGISCVGGISYWINQYIGKNDEYDDSCLILFSTIIMIVLNLIVLAMH